MDGFAVARRMMVDGQVRPSDITDGRVIDAFLAVPREKFVGADRAALAYLDLDLAVGDGDEKGHLLKPMTLAKLIQAAAIKPSDTVLDVGCATGYSSALLAQLAGRVIALEESSALARAAEVNLAALGIAHVTVRIGALPRGSVQDGPFDAILINGAIDFVPPDLVGQLREGGRLVCIIRTGPVSKATLYLAGEGGFSGRPIFGCSAPLLPSFVEDAVFTF